jgi:hypothetical protein
MKLCIEIEVDDRAPNEEFCGKGCTGLKNGICHLFNTKLEDYSQRKIDDMKDGAIVYDETRIIYEWKRCPQCIEKFYAFGKAKSN